MKGSRKLLSAVCVLALTLAFAGIAAAQDASPSPSPTPNKGQCRSYPYRIKALNKQLERQNAKKVRTQERLDRVLELIAANPTPSPTASPSPTPSPEVENGKKHKHKRIHLRHRDDHVRGSKSGRLEKLRDALLRKLEEVADRIEQINLKIESLTAKLALCPTPTPSPSPTATPTV